MTRPSGTLHGHGGFDSSGLTMAACQAAGMNLPRTVQEQCNAGPRVPKDGPLAPGDLVFYGTPGNIHHVGICISAGKTISSPDFGRPVKVDDYRWKGDDYAGASRPNSPPCNEVVSGVTRGSDRLTGWSGGRASGAGVRGAASGQGHRSIRDEARGLDDRSLVASAR
nr:NlpC/P60 family protein [Saccharopolyspora soli]